MLTLAHHPACLALIQAYFKAYPAAEAQSRRLSALLGLDPAIPLLSQAMYHALGDFGVQQGLLEQAAYQRLITATWCLVAQRHPQAQHQNDAGESHRGHSDSRRRGDG